LDRIRSRLVTPNTILVIGLGRFGMSLAVTLEELGHEVIGVDVDPRPVAELRDRITQTVEADSTNIDALRQIGAETVRHAIVAIGNNMEASILTTSALVDVGIPDVWAKALSGPHQRILERVGATHVVQPERDMGRRLAHLVTGEAIDYLELDDNFAVVETTTPSELVGMTIAEADIRNRFDVTVVCVRFGNGGFTYASPEQRIDAGTVLVVAGATRDVDRFADLD
jgi:trk system potassium uptake protein TrkA